MSDIPWVEVAKALVREACAPDGVRVPADELERWLAALADSPDGRDESV